mgnify:FL=1
MKDLIPMDEYGCLAGKDKTVRVSSLYVAKVFNKQHKNVLRDIEKITDPNSGLSEEFNRLNFEPISYKDQWNRKQLCYFMTRDGFTMLVMGYTGNKAMQFKEFYINRFNELETTVEALVSAKNEFPALTNAIQMCHETPKPYHYSNEVNMLYKLVIGKTTSQFRTENELEKGTSIRPYMSKGQLEMLDKLQKVDIGLLVAFPEYEERKRHLEWYKSKLEDEGKWMN